MINQYLAHHKSENMAKVARSKIGEAARRQQKSMAAKA